MNEWLTGTPGDYNQWKALGNPGWGYEDLEPYFVKSEKTYSHPASKFRGHDGLGSRLFLVLHESLTSPYPVQEVGRIGLPKIRTTRINSKSSARNAYMNSHSYGALTSIVRALQKVGIEQVPDLNAPDAPAACVGRTDHIVDNSHDRDSTYRAFLSPKLTQERKSRLKICTNTLVTRIELAESEHGLHAVGVHFEADDPRLARHKYFAKAAREIVLCAGALASPQILMLRFVRLVTYCDVAFNVMLQRSWA